MILSSWLNDLFRSLAVGIAGSALATVALYGVQRRQRRKVLALAERQIGDDALRTAAPKASQDPSLIRNVLESLIAEVAEDQGLPANYVRASLFERCTDNSFRTPAGLAINFESADEARITVQPGESGVGDAAVKGEPVITIFKEPGVDSTIADATERARIDPRQRWILSLPVVTDGDLVIWVLAIDGLNEERTLEQLRPSIGKLLYYRELLNLILREAA